MPLPYHLTSRTIERFLREYSIKCISHTVLIPGETRRCACSKPITSNFYLFSYSKDKEEGSFASGPSCGKRLIEQAKISCPPLFDPFKSSSVVRTPSYNSPVDTVISNVLRFSPLNKEIYNLLNLYRCMICKDLEGSLLTIFSYITKNPTGNVYDNYFLTINDAINDAVENTEFQTLQDYFEHFANAHNKRFKKFEFPLFKEKLASVHGN